MRGKFLTGITTGAIIGAAAGMMFMPEMDRGTKRRIRKSAYSVRNIAGDVFDNMKGWMR
jgi:gas vesicle protein